MNKSLKTLAAFAGVGAITVLLSGAAASRAEARVFKRAEKEVSRLRGDIERAERLRQERKAELRQQLREVERLLRSVREKRRASNDLVEDVAEFLSNITRLPIIASEAEAGTMERMLEELRDNLERELEK